MTRMERIAAPAMILSFIGDLLAAPNRDFCRSLDAEGNILESATKNNKG